MIGKLKGVIDEIEEESIILDVGGVGYKVLVMPSMLFNLQPKQPLTLYTEMIVREDQLTLYGFADKTEQKWFNILQTVQGVGAKVALGILAQMSPNSIVGAIISEDEKAFKAISGIGSKIATRIVNELKNHSEMKNVHNLIRPENASKEMNASQIGVAQSVFADAMNALAGLGFSRSESYKVLSELSNDNLNLEDLIRHALAHLAPKH